jgi:Lhr-like helicase
MFSRKVNDIIIKLEEYNFNYVEIDIEGAKKSTNKNDVYEQLFEIYEDEEIVNEMIEDLDSMVQKSIPNLIFTNENLDIELCFFEKNDMWTINKIELDNDILSEDLIKDFKEELKMDENDKDPEIFSLEPYNKISTNELYSKLITYNFNINDILKSSSN